ncbi:virion structural protein [Xanthomonas phage vB_Xar_IVIA-DoCa1]|uniref:Virion structural protein n=1 Tax=Xanthomonas phage vB_Xar_IVIA-DoCa1 TaxID=2970490 RepID=A0A976XI11_9CAUD|nr:virion structural protein [Xanthomonas phage vB_Xar_IVIA-DoCa1]UVB02930.1 virion structural protein [Xanthomonas phage vB_Xar_IVIA-DoCa1]
MAAKKVIFFTAGTTPTSGELAAIAKLNAAADKPYEVTVMNNAKTVINPDAIPVQNLPNTQAVVTNGQKITGVTGSGTVANIVVNPTTKAVTVTLSAS